MPRVFRAPSSPAPGCGWPCARARPPDREVSRQLPDSREEPPGLAVYRLDEVPDFIERLRKHRAVLAQRARELNAGPMAITLGGDLEDRSVERGHFRRRMRAAFGEFLVD